MNKLNNFQSLFQLGVGFSIALQYFYDYQDRLSHEFSNKMDITTDNSKKLLKHIQSIKVSGCQNQEQKAEKDLDYANKLNETRRMSSIRIWKHIHKSRVHSNDMRYWCFFCAIPDILLLSTSSICGDADLNPTYSFLLFIMFTVPHIFLMYHTAMVYRACNIIEKALRVNEDRSEANKFTIDNIEIGDEPGIIHFFDLQINRRLNSTNNGN